MTDAPMPEGVTTSVDRNTASATGIVAASPAAVFDYLRRPANHVELSGDASVRGARVGPDVLGAGERFGMRMKQFGVPYRITSRVSEFEPERRIAWAHMVGHTWRWELETLGDSEAKVTETFDLSTAKFPPALRLMGYPRGHVANVARSVANLRARFDGGG